MNLIIICGLILFSSFSKKNKLPNSGISLKITVESFHQESLKIKTELKNNTTDTLSYLSMTCSWWEFYHFSTMAIKKKSCRCDSNTPTVIKIAPNEIHKEILDLKIINKKLFLENTLYKVGFEFIPVALDDNLYDLEYTYRDCYFKGKKELIWSNEIKLR
jgi:hypothetical protein